jgi:hypothetical protein
MDRSNLFGRKVKSQVAIQSIWSLASGAEHPYCLARLQIGRGLKAFIVLVMKLR